MRKVYVVMESVDCQWKPRVVYKEKRRALHWIEIACFGNDDNASKFMIEEVEGVGL